MKGDRIKQRQRRERVTELQVALTLLLKDYPDVDHYDRFGVLRSLAENEIYSYAFDDGARSKKEAA